MELTDGYLTIKDQEDDSFSRYYNPDIPIRKKKKAHACQIRKQRSEYEPLQVMESIGKRAFENIKRKGRVHVCTSYNGISLCDS